MGNASCTSSLLRSKLRTFFADTRCELSQFFGGVGIAVLPLSLIFAFIRRPKTIITRAQYIKEATELGKRAKEIREVALALQREERSGSKGRKWKKNVKQIQQVRKTCGASSLAQHWCDANL